MKMPDGAVASRQNVAAFMAILSVAVAVQLQQDVQAHGSIVRRQVSGEHEVFAAHQLEEQPEEKQPEEKQPEALVDETQLEEQPSHQIDAKDDAIMANAVASQPLKVCDRRRRDLCSCRHPDNCCNVQRCGPQAFTGGPMKIKQAPTDTTDTPTGCSRYLVAKENCSHDGVEVKNFSDAVEPPLYAQWGIWDTGSGSNYTLVNLARQNAACERIYLAADHLSPSMSGGALRMTMQLHATDFEIEIHEYTPYHQFKVAGAMANQMDHAFLKNPAVCNEGALPTMGLVPDLWQLMPAGSPYSLSGAVSR